MKTAKVLINERISPSIRAHARPRRAGKLGALGFLCLAASLLPSSAQAQTNMTIKPVLVRVEVPTEFNGTTYLTNCNLRIPTNGATGVDGTGTNWVIANVNASISGAPAGCTASLLNSDLTTPVGSIPVNLNTNSTAQNTNLIVRLAFDGSEASGVTTLTITASGAGLPDDTFPLVLEVAKIWHGSGNAGVNGAGAWSDSTRWLSSGTPGPNDDVVFTEVGMQTNSLISTSTTTNQLANSVIDASITISSLRISEVASNSFGTTNWQNLYINAGQTLGIAGSGGFSMLRDYSYGGNKLNVSIWGTNGTVAVTNESASFALLVDGQQASLLDMSGLGNLIVDVNNLPIGDCLAYPNFLSLCTNGFSSGSTVGSSRPQKMYITWRMPLTNYIKAVYADPFNYANASSRSYAMLIGRNDATGGSSANDYVVSMGRTNAFFMDGICVAGYGSLGSLLNFQTTNSYAFFRNADGGRMSVFAVGDAAGVGALGANVGVNTKAGSTTTFGVDFTGNGNTVDMQVDQFYMSMDRGHTTADGVVQSGLGLSEGTINANNAFICYQASGDQTNKNQCTATLVVSNLGVFQVNGTLALGYTASTAGDPSSPGTSFGQLKIGPGGTVIASNITVGGITKATAGNNINLTAGGSLIVSNGIADATPGGALGTLSFGGNSSLTLFVDGSKPSAALVYLTNLTASGVGNKLIIGDVANVTFPVDVPLIKGVSDAISPTVFDAGVVMPEGSGLTGILTLSTSNTINLRILNRTPNNLLWRAPGSTADWDRTTKNWLDMNTGIMTNYDDPDIVSFDDTPGFATNINVTGGPNSLTPTAVNLTNSALYYTFLDGGNTIIGSPTLNKYGSGTVEVDVNTSLSAHLNEGALVGTAGGALGGVNVASGTVMNFSGAIVGSLTCAGTATSAGNVSGTLTVQPGGVVTNSGTVANPFAVQTNGYLFNSSLGTLNNIGTGSAASPQVAVGGILVNDGNINGDVLFVSGIFEDLGTAGMTLTSLSLGSGATFIPGGDGIGNTTINSDGVGNFPGAALLAQGSTTIFKVDPATPTNTVLTADHLSFGASSSQQTQNGATLMITNISATPFAAGQTFQLFANLFNPAIGPFNTGSSTNTYPAITPATPGPGLVWDLRHLWTPDSLNHSGLIGVIGATSGQPTLTNSFTLQNGTNMMAQFSWDPNNIGMRLESLTTPNTVGLTPNTNYNWVGISGSWTNTSVTITNKLTTNDMFFRLIFP